MDKDSLFPRMRFRGGEDCERSGILFVRIEFTPCEILLEYLWVGKIERETEIIIYYYRLTIERYILFLIFKKKSFIINAL